MCGFYPVLSVTLQTYILVNPMENLNISVTSSLDVCSRTAWRQEKRVTSKHLELDQTQVHLTLSV